ncbi:unnamed protein product, partial [Coccothraustes coccothraustes]
MLGVVTTDCSSSTGPASPQLQPGRGESSRAGWPLPVEKSNVPGTTSVPQSPHRCLATAVCDQLSILCPRCPHCSPLQHRITTTPPPSSLVLPKNSLHLSEHIKNQSRKREQSSCGCRDQEERRGARFGTSDVALRACHSPGHSSNYPEQSSGAAIPWGTGLSGSSLCWSLTVATGEEAQTCEADLASDADCSTLQAVSEVQMLQRNKK